MRPLSTENALSFTHDFARTHVTPQAASWENDHQPAEDTVRYAAASGFAGLLVPEEDGGSALPVETVIALFEALAAAHLPFAFALVVHANLCSAVSRLGSAQQKSDYLPDLLSGRKIGAFCLTEKTAGSDPASISTYAERRADGWWISGEKAWVTNGAYADVLSVYAQTDASQGSRGIATFLINAGGHPITRLDNYRLLGAHAMGTTGLVFDNISLADDAVQAPPGRGFKAAMAGIDLARVLLSGTCCGMLKASLDYTVDYVRKRQAFGQAVAEYQGIQWQLADVATALAAARALCYEAARLLDQKSISKASLKAAQAKKFATKTARDGIAVCMQALGANALRCDEDNPLSRHFASAQVCEYLDGTTGIQNIVIARRLFAGT